MTIIDINTVYNEDCLITMGRMPDNCIDLIVSSPPYDNFREFAGSNDVDINAVINELYRITKVGGVVVWVISDQIKDGDESGTSFRQALYFKEIGFKLFDTMIYSKPARGVVGSNRAYINCFEYMFVFSKKEVPKTINLIRDEKNVGRKSQSVSRRTGDKLNRVRKYADNEMRRRTNIWLYRTGSTHTSKDFFVFEHPAVFPEKLVRDHIISWSNEGDLVYDPFAGSGTVPKIALQTGRYYLGNEINPKYYEICKKRVNTSQSLFPPVRGPPKIEER